MKVLYVASEALPFAASGGLADVAGSLPAALRKKKVACRVVMPLYGSIGDEMRAQMKFITNIMVPVSWRRQYCGIFEARANGVTYYLLDNEYYFKRNTLYGHYDDGERFAFFSRAVLEILPYIDFKPDIIHCNDWQSALIPVYYTTYYARMEGYTGIKTVFTIHNIQYQGIYGKEILGDVFGLGEEHYSLVEFGDDINLMKGAIECANKVTTVSHTYAEETLDPWFSHGLHPILKERSYKLSGILNGIDTDNYNPETDKNIAVNYSVDDKSGKAADKKALQEIFGQIDHSCANQNHALSLSELEKLVSSHKDIFIKGCMEPERCRRDAKVCDIGDARLNLDAEGFYYPCDGFHGAILGDARKDSLWEVWTGEALNKLRALKNKDFGSCASCADRAWCKVCPMRNFNETGNMFMHAPWRCEATRIYRRIFEEK